MNVVSPLVPDPVKDLVSTLKRSLGKSEMNIFRCTTSAVPWQQWPSWRKCSQAGEGAGNFECQITEQISNNFYADKVLQPGVWDVLSDISFSANDLSPSASGSRWVCIDRQLHVAGPFL